MRLGKRLKNIYSQIEPEKALSVADSVKLLQSTSATKFDETVDIAINLGVDPRHADQIVRGSVALPNGIGKKVRVAVFAKGDNAEKAKESGADIVGDEDLVAEIEKGNLDFDRCLATPDLMGLVGKLGRVLGPRGLMPNPKLGQVTFDIANAIKEAKSGQVIFKTDKTGIVHAGVGKISFSADKLIDNVNFFIKHVKDMRPSGAKGAYILKIVLSSTMGPGVMLDIKSII